MGVLLSLDEEKDEGLIQKLRAYEITKEKQDLLLDFFKQRSQGPLTRRKKNYTLNKDIKIS